MSNLDKLFERIYSENDFGRSIATSIAGIIGLIIYLLINDWIISIFSAIISFPIARLVATWLYEKARRAHNRYLERERAKYVYDCLSNDEKQVVKAFVEVGGSVLTWSQVNALELSSLAIESLIHREMLKTSVTADAMRETFVLDAFIFDAGLNDKRLSKSS